MSAGAALLVGLSAGAAQAGASRAWLDARSALSACRANPDAVARGACLERAAEALDAAEARGEGPIPSPVQARETRKRDFGLRLPPPAAPPRIAGVRPRDEERPDRLVTTLASARQDGEGNWIMTTAEGAVWRQTDKAYIVRPPHAGSTFFARPAALGSYFCLIDGRREVRCKRRG